MTQISLDTNIFGILTGRGEPYLTIATNFDIVECMRKQMVSQSRQDVVDFWAELNAVGKWGARTQRWFHQIFGHTRRDGQFGERIATQNAFGRTKVFFVPIDLDQFFLMLCREQFCKDDGYIFCKIAWTPSRYLNLSMRIDKYVESMV